MLIPYLKYSGLFCIAYPIIVIFCAFYAYRVNEKKTPDDPEKKEFSPRAIWLAPVTLPFLILFNAIIVTLSSLAFGVFLILFSFALVLFRKPFLIKWILKQALKTGNMLLKINTKLLRAFGFYPPPTIKLQLEG
jgi:hypothetical protein